MKSLESQKKQKDSLFKIIMKTISLNLFKSLKISKLSYLMIIMLFHYLLLLKKKLKEILKLVNLKNLKSESLKIKILLSKNLKILKTILFKFKSYQMKIYLSQFQAKKDHMIKSAHLCQLFKKKLIKMF